MFNIDKNTGALIAAETQGTLRAIDNAILSELRLCSSLVEACEQAHLPIRSSQKLLQSITSGLSQIVAGRGELAQTARALSVIKAGSSLAETSYNCPGEPPPMMAAAPVEVPEAGSETVFG